MKLNEIILILKRLYQNYVKTHIKRIFFSLILSIIVAGSTASIAWLLDPAIKKVFIEQDKTYAILIPIGIIMAFAGKGLSLFYARINVIKVGYWICAQLQREMSNKILISDTSTIDDKHSGKYISNFLYDSTMVQQLVSTGVLNIMKDSITLVALLVLMFYQNWKLALFSLIMMPMSAYVAKSLGKRMGKASTESADLSGNLSSLLAEIIRGSKIIKIYQTEEFEQKKADVAITNLNNKFIKMATILIRATPIMECLTGIMIAGFIYYSGILIASGELAINNFFSFLTAMMLSYQPIRSLATINMTIYQGAAGAKRVFKVIDEKVNIKQNSLEKLSISDSNIKFKNINFKYKSSNKAVVKDINLEIKGGTMAALVGHSGAGKSTILNLMPRFYDAQSGTISIDNQNIYEISLESLRKNISLVSQDVILFDDTIEANILYANQNASENDLIDSCKFAAAHDFITELPNGYKTLIGENGIKLSGGQKQRISIARAVLKDSPIILLDEATSSLDADSEEIVQNAITNLTKNKTTLVIAHRLSTIFNADKIFVMKKGEIIDSGKHKELIVNCDEYKSLYQKQLK
jgi:subfamily B ATP-binding cassette protein MsbA